MTEVSTLLEFLEATGAKVRIYDVGRRLSKISRNDFLKIEKQEMVYPYPLQQQAWFGMSMLDTSVSAEPVIWFLRMPLDETGKLQLASRDYFMHRLFEAAAAKKTESPELSADALKDNPHVFKPREDKMAVFHARLSVTIKQPPSRFYAHTIEYLSGSQGWEQWNFVGLQGIADFVERLDHEQNHELLLGALPHLPVQPLQAICQCLENREIPLKLTEALVLCLNDELEARETDPLTVANLLRALSQTVSKKHRQQVFSQVFAHTVSNSEEVLAAVGARCWQWLDEPSCMAVYLQKLAGLAQDSFNACLTDLMFMPGLREPVLQTIRSPQRPDALATAFYAMLQGHQA